jgi:hypothetical protein
MAYEDIEIISAIFAGSGITGVSGKKSSISPKKISVSLISFEIPPSMFYPNQSNRGANGKVHK